MRCNLYLVFWVIFLRWGIVNWGELYPFSHFLTENPFLENNLEFMKHRKICHIKQVIFLESLLILLKDQRPPSKPSMLSKNSIFNGKQIFFHATIIFLHFPGNFTVKNVIPLLNGLFVCFLNARCKKQQWKNLKIYF